MAAVDGSSGWQGEKISKKHFVLNKLKSPKNIMSFFVFIQIWGVGGMNQEEMWINPHFFIPSPNRA